MDVRWRTVDDAQDLAGRRLLLKGFRDLSIGLRQRAVLLLQFREEAHVLDGDDRLVGEGLQELDLLLRERSGLRSGRGDHADRVPMMEHRDSQAATVSCHLRHVGQLVLRIGENVWNLDNVTRQDDPTACTRSGRRPRKCAP